jgi:hypothetical protein
MCRVLRVSRAGYYAWRRRATPTRVVADAALTTAIEAVRAESRRTHAPVDSGSSGYAEYDCSFCNQLNGMIERPYRADPNRETPSS